MDLLCARHCAHQAVGVPRGIWYLVFGLQVMTFSLACRATQNKEHLSHLKKGEMSRWTTLSAWCPDIVSSLAAPDPFLWHPYILVYMCVHVCWVVSIVSDSLWPCWAVAPQTPLSVEFSRQEYWSGLPFPPPGDLPDPGIEATSLTSPAWAGDFFTTSTTQKHGGSSVFLISLLFLACSVRSGARNLANWMFHAPIPAATAMGCRYPRWVLQSVVSCSIGGEVLVIHTWPVPPECLPLPSEVLTLPVGVCMLSHCFPKHNAMLGARGEGAVSPGDSSAPSQWTVDAGSLAIHITQSGFFYQTKTIWLWVQFLSLPSPWRVKPSCREGRGRRDPPCAPASPSCVALGQTCVPPLPPGREPFSLCKGNGLLVSPGADHWSGFIPKWAPLSRAHKDTL